MKHLKKFNENIKYQNTDITVLDYRNNLSKISKPSTYEINRIKNIFSDYIVEEMKIGAFTIGIDEDHFYDNPYYYTFYKDDDSWWYFIDLDDGVNWWDLNNIYQQSEIEFDYQEFEAYKCDDIDGLIKLLKDKDII